MYLISVVYNPKTNIVCAISASNNTIALQKWDGRESIWFRLKANFVEPKTKENDRKGRKEKVAKHKTTEITNIKVFLRMRWVYSFYNFSCCCWCKRVQMSHEFQREKNNPKTKWLDHWLTQAHWMEFYAHDQHIVHS